MLSFIALFASLPSKPNEQKESRRRVSRQRDGGVGSTVALNRILFENNERSANGTVTLQRHDDRASHVCEVLGLPPTGGTVRAGIIDRYLLDDVPVKWDDDGDVSFDLSRGMRRELPPAPGISLILAVPRPKVLARLLPQIAAIGVRNIVLCNAYKVEKCYFDSGLLTRPQEVCELLKEGVSQAGCDSRLPTFAVEKRLKVFLEDRLVTMTPPQSSLIIAEPGSKASMFEILAQSRETAQPRDGSSGEHIVVAIGPEGGWMPREVSMFEEQFGFRRVRLGERILRTDAATLILLGLAHEYLRMGPGR